MLSSRWESVSVYSCSGYHKSYYVLAASRENAIEAFEEATGDTAMEVYVVLSCDPIMVTEEAQAQSELFPNQVRK